MAFIPIMLSGFLMGIWGIGGICLFIGLIMMLIARARRKKGKKDGFFAKLIRITLVGTGVVTFLIPNFILYIISIYQGYKRDAKMKGLKNKVYAKDFDNWEDGFTFKGTEYVRMEYLTPTGEDREALGYMVFDSMSYLGIDPVDNEYGWDIKAIKQKVYCAESDKASIEDYYENEAKMGYTLHVYEGDDNTAYALDIDRGVYNSVLDRYNEECNYTASTEEVDYAYRLTARSEDDMYFSSFSIDVVDDDVILLKETAAGEIKGVLIEGADAEKLAAAIDAAY